MKDKTLFNKAHKALGKPYSGGLVHWEDIKSMEKIDASSPTLYHVVLEEGYKIILAMVKI